MEGREAGQALAGYSRTMYRYTNDQFLATFSMVFGWIFHRFRGFWSLVYPLGQGLTRLPTFQGIVLEDYWELESKLGT